MFPFSNLTNLVIVDEDGNVLSTAEKTADGFAFSHLPTSGEYFYKLENMPEGTEFDFMELNIIEEGMKKKIVANVSSSIKTSKTDNTNQKIINSLIALDNQGIESIRKSEARKGTMIQLIAFSD